MRVGVAGRQFGCCRVRVGSFGGRFDGCAKRRTVMSNALAAPHFQLEVEAGRRRAVGFAKSSSPGVPPPPEGIAFCSSLVATYGILLFYMY